MRRSQVFNPQDLDLMGKVFLRASYDWPRQNEKQKLALARAIVITYRSKLSEAALAAAALHLVGLRVLH